MTVDVIEIYEIFSRIIGDSLYVNKFMFGDSNSITKYTDHHQFKIAHFCLHLGEELKLNKEMLHDLFLLGLFHDIGFISLEVFSSIAKGRETLLDYEKIVNHCTLGERLIKSFEFYTDIKNVVLYHHDNFDGTGFFGASGKDIPLCARIIRIADELDFSFNLDNIKTKSKQMIDCLNKNSGKFFDPDLIESSIKVITNHKNSKFSIRCDKIPVKILEYNWDNLIETTALLMKIIDSKSKFTYTHSSTITNYSDILGKHYDFDNDKLKQLHIAANLHDMGKLVVPISILEKPLKLSADEFYIIKQHPLIAAESLKGNPVFSNISRWILQHHEKLDGSGYPYGLLSKEIDFESQILTVCDIYTALLEERPYRKALPYEKANSILLDMAEHGKINKKVVNDLLYLTNQQANQI